MRVDYAVQISNQTPWSDVPLGRAPQKRRRVPFEKQLQSLVATFYCLMKGEQRCDWLLGHRKWGRTSHTMLWWLFLSMMSDEGSSSFLIGEGGGVAGLTLGLNRSDT